ncbi:hypothetical protein IQ264_05200 [Phormidium sp. LEGE 05292]|uniref:hypothetical protein n=1 Tax=[Phormidium] sp. LEGE 05292 TaxID=767427 RepID=UPI001880D449|nr:hypothetical protein [Phormidium sp. LEGE 05292]MBE9224863.1 hypothetical protein [Phormidium sp. LEGE 05292]
MQYRFERLRFHFVEHTVRQVWQDGNAATKVMDSLQQELERSLTDEEALNLKDHIQLLCSETDKLLRSRIPHDFPSRQKAIELWGYQQIQPLHSDIYIHHEQPTESDFDSQFALPPSEVWMWNVVYTFTGPYYGIQTEANGQAATSYADLGSLDFVLQSAEILKTFPNCELLGDLTADNIDLFTLEADECRRISQTLQQQQDAVTEALSQLIQGDDRQYHATIVVNTWQVPLQAAQNQGIAQFKYGKRIHSVEYSENEA